MTKIELPIAELAQRLNAELFGDGSGTINSVGPIGSADNNAVTFLANYKLLRRIKQSGAGAVIIDKKIDDLSMPQIIVKNVNAALIDTLKIFAPKLEPATPGINSMAQIGKNVKMGKNVSIGAFVLIETGVEIGDNTVISAGCKIGQNTRIGQDCRLDCNVVIYHNCQIGNSVIIQANTTIGSTGFGYYFIDGQHRLIPHNGIVVIEDFVEIGANCCVDRAKFAETRIGAGTKIDNLVQIAHNVTIGKCCLMAGQAGIGGSTKVGDGVVFAGGAAALDNIEIGDGVLIGVRGLALNSIEPGTQVLGYPAIERKEALRVWASSQRLPKLMEQFRQLCARVEKLEASKDDSQSGRT
ncbi:MAG: UDP-3-O-(3-hydroxymyristoyl)glucosamine N-acyltransferase [Sedimentisphaerales bacterium]|nr:UDP-3-O-(3-hydroxymyristoyl)glucosamine N-acyltransferase [Sedimentisphaerales bacterium]